MAADLLDPIPLSALQYGCYCWCQCTLIRIEQVFAENLTTLPGQALHEGRIARLASLIASPPATGAWI
jgi:CRISPR-associated exonuclease Cas4